MTSLKHPQLSGLGRNPAASDDILVRLAVHGAGRHGMAQRRERLADTVAEAVLRHGGGDIVVALRRDRVSPAMRRRIAGHPDPAIREGFADFVRTTVDLEVQLPIDDLEEVYGRPRAALAESSDPKLRAAVAQSWHERPEPVQTALLTDPDPTVRTAAALYKQPGVPAELRDRCLADPAVRTHVARHVPLTSAQFAELMRVKDVKLHRAVAANPHLSADMVNRLLQIADLDVRIALAISRHLDTPTRDRLFALVEAERAEGSDDARIALTWRPGEPTWLCELPLGERLTCLDSPHAVFRRALARCPDLPEEAWRRLDDDPDLSVRRIAARRPDAPSEVLEKLVRAHGDVFHLKPLHVDHPNFPRHALRTFVDEPDPDVRYVALQDPRLPVPALHRLAGAPEPFLRRGVARHPNITDALLERLLVDPDPKVADAAAANPVLGPARMDRILTDAGL
ncbi:hypothetical protein [Streptomyces sp. S.PB5]|uniref:hypothetical protein n=1 Tax=Streptomyces sp. S.PB5 TaxID=3020844 RepID=UPI0025B1BDE5|nr:hypothetical protein [Streptomyces sp. S.PB5]MDN3029519.1 hypothetical protein [Streptomyces sp. S.PB5]